MRTKLLLIVIMGMMIPFAGFTEEQNEANAAESERYCEEEYEEGERGNGYYPCDEEEFMVGDRIYRWFVYPSGRRVLKCREVYYDEEYGIYFGPWEVAVYFNWYDYYPNYFTYCPVLHIYYYNHPYYVTYYHHLHHYVYYNIYPIHHHHWAHYTFHWHWKPWVHWKPWHYKKHNKWHTVWHQKHKIHHPYKPHIKQGKQQGHFIKKHPYVKKQVNYGRKPVKVVNKTTLPKPVQKGQYINKKKVITKSDYIKQVKTPTQTKQVKANNQVKKVNKPQPATQIKKYNQVSQKKAYTKKETYNYSTNKNKGTVNNQYTKTKPAQKSYTVQNNKKATSYTYKPVKPAQKNNSYSAQKHSSSSKPVSGNTVKRATQNTRQTHGRRR